METPPNNLRFPLTTFVGRDQDLDAVRGRLATSRLVTLVGTAGVGKSRLALEAASGLLDQSPDGVWFVELAGVSEPGLVAQSVASLLNITEQPGISLLDGLASACRGRSMLLVLDSCEHLLGPCAALAERLLGACPRLRVLATSRTPLRIAGETIWEVRPLPLADFGARPSLDRLARSDAVQLFVARASGAAPGFALTAQNADAVWQICRRLDGIPLALELAASWVRTLSVAQIAARLDDRFRLLEDGRRIGPLKHQSLRGAIAWSYDLLHPAERTLFNRLSVFAGSCSLDTIEAVCAGDDLEPQDVLPILARLVDTSLVVADEIGGQKRFRLLETLRAFGREQLVVVGGSERTNDRHAQHYLALAEAAEPELWGPEMSAWLERLEAEHDDLRAALRWTVGRGESEIALRLGAALARFWQVRGHLSEGLRWLEGGLVWGTGVSPETRARALDAAGHLARDRGDHERAARFYEDALALRREIGEPRAIALALNNLGVIAQFRGDHTRAIGMHEESLARFREVGDEQGVAITLLTLGVMEHLRGDVEPAAARCEEALDHFRRLEDRQGVAASLNNLGNFASARGDHAAAEAFYADSLDLFRALNERREIGACLRNLAGVALARGSIERARSLCREGLSLSAELGDWLGIAAGFELAARIEAACGHAERAVTLLGAAATARAQAGGAPRPAHGKEYEDSIGNLRAALGPNRFEAAWTSGRALSPSDAVATALASGAAPDASAKAVGSGALTRREREVAALIARGHTNRQIADALYISERTADTHVEHILAKLNLRSRALVATWAVEHGLAQASTP